jgi:hypothetical protein
VRAKTLTLRAVALLAAGSAAIHQLRYAIGYGAAADHELAAHGHGYLEFALPVVVAVTVAAMAAVVVRFARGGSTPRPPASFAALWLGSVAVIAAIYGIQESIEGAGAIAGGGWIGLALAIPAGLCVALAIKGASVADEGIRARRAALGFHNFVEAAPGGPARIGAGRTRTSGLGARAPPLASVV